MAIKERKQITGTTAQINAYAGHEGQIVWDKDKKTFVGMSGTAGKNYPLAQQAYVDTKFLPLTGGNMTGELILNNLASVIQQNIPEYEEILLQSYDRTNSWTGGLLTCRGHSGSVEAERGSFLLGARYKDGSGNGYLLGTPAGSLVWQGNEVLRVAGAGNGPSRGWVRYYPNLQICFGADATGANGSSLITFDVPFSGVGCVSATIRGDGASEGVAWSTLVEVNNGNYFKVHTIRNIALQPYAPFFWFAIGYY